MDRLPDGGTAAIRNVALIGREGGGPNKISPSGRFSLVDAEGVETITSFFVQTRLSYSLSVIFRGLHPPLKTFESMSQVAAVPQSNEVVQVGRWLVAYFPEITPG